MEIVGCGWDERKAIIRLAVESSEFDEVREGDFSPDFTPTFTVIEESDIDVLNRLLSKDT